MSVSNTYIEPTAGTSLNTARSQFNDSLRAVLTNFKMLGTPGANQFFIGGVPTSVPDGVLFRSERTNAIYISDSVHKKTSPVGGNFTRWGIGHRVEANASAFSDLATRATYEIGELVGVLDTGKLYFRNSNIDSSTSFVDVGTTQGYTVSGPFNNATFTGQSVTGINLIATNSLTVGTANPTAPLDVRGNASITGNTFIGNLVYHVGDGNSYFGFPVATTDTYVVATNGVERIRVDSAGRVIYGHTSALPALNIGGANITPAIQNIGTTLDDAAYSAFSFENNANGPIVALLKSRGTVKGTYTAVATDDNLGSIIFSGVDSSGGLENSARITALVDATPTANAVPGRLVFATGSSTGLSERMRITSTGSIGVANTTPAHALDVTGTIRASIAVRTAAILDAAGGNTASINGITPAYATQAEAQAGSNTTKLMTPARVVDYVNDRFGVATGDTPLYGCRAWANFNGTGNVAIRAFGNISSITDNGVGDYTLNFTKAMPDANYAVNITIGGDGTTQSTQIISQTASNVRIGLSRSGVGPIDQPTVCVTVFR